MAKRRNGKRNDMHPAPIFLPIFLLATAIATPVATPVTDVPGGTPPSLRFGGRVSKPALASAGTLACGMNINDWCPAPPGDPCGRHRDTAACMADPACYGMPYRGESFVPCVLDARGFSSNCPTVGCTSTPPPRGR